MDEEEIVLLSDKELDTYIGKNYEADLMRALRKLQTFTAEENKLLLVTAIKNSFIKCGGCFMRKRNLRRT